MRLGVKIDFEPADATSIHYDIIRSFDRRLVNVEKLDQLTDGRVTTELDWQLYQLQRRYLDYQVNVANRMIELLSSGDPETRAKATEAAMIKTHFQVLDEAVENGALSGAVAAAEHVDIWTHVQDLVDDLFGETGKRIDRKSNELNFIQYDEPLQPYLLSSGEKQMLIILLTVLTEDRQPYVLFMDEPEASLHFEWQKRLIGMIRDLNPNAQIILTTHSPAVIIDGWQDVVTDVSDITVRP